MNPTLATKIPLTGNRPSVIAAIYGRGDTWPTHRAKARRKTAAKRARRRVRVTGTKRR
ncbi:hypothetical protein [Nocardia fluminea]|uniref:hypothetical protein n=1 Tax=Nocardia fluminea TaxID=134984 RepID=UPI003D127B55